MLVFLLEVAATIILLIFIFLLIIVAFCDADLMLMLRTKFGKQPDSLAGQVVWVTGASSGIGEHYVYCLAESGCKLVLSARRKEELDRVKAACLTSARCKVREEDILVLPLDITDFKQHAQKVQEVLDYFKKIDILINNAGKSQRALWTEVELEVDRELFEINAMGPVSLTQAVLPYMAERKQGHIVVVSSLAGKLGTAGMRSYTAAKHAVHGFFDCLRTEVADDNIKVTIICPGPVHSNALLYAATGKSGEKLGQPMLRSERRMLPERCAYLSCVAVANSVYEAWLSPNPALLAVYVRQYLPGFLAWSMCKIGRKQVMAIREGKS